MKFVSLALAGAAALSVAGACQAQPGQGPRGSAVSPRPSEAPSARPYSQAERAARLRDLLQLRPAQEAALQAYVAALDTARHGMRDHAGEPMPRTTPERLARMEQRMAARQREGAAVIAATRAFYGQLDADQKRAFDAMPMKMGGHGMGRGRMGRGEMHGGHAPARPAPAPVR